MKCGEGANTERHIAEQILGQIEGADGRSNSVKWQVIELVVGEIENREARGPLCYVWDLGELVVGEIQLSQARQLQKTLWDGDQLIMLEINLYNLKKKTVKIISSTGTIALYGWCTILQAHTWDRTARYQG